MQRKYPFLALVILCLISNIYGVYGQYCIPNPTYGVQYGTYIDSVNLGDINYQTAYNTTDPSYSDNTMAYYGKTLLTKGKSYVLTIKGGTYTSSMHYAAWIDYNNDHDFTDSGESLGEDITYTGNRIYTISFVVPSVSNTVTTRLRVRCVWNNTPDPCTNYDYGETEDYTVSVTDFLKTDPSIAGTMGEVAFFNYDNDKDLDIMLQDETAATEAVKFYNNSGTFSKVTLLSPADLPDPDNENLSYNFFDQNNDNSLDALFTYRVTSSEAPKTVNYVKSGSNLVYTASDIANLRKGSSAAADFDNDGRQDIIICGLDNTGIPHTYIYQNTPNGFILVNDKLKGVYGQVLAVDYDNDKDLDIFISGADRYGSTNAIIYRNDGNWQFTDILANLNKIDWLSKSEFGDFNNDRYPDIVIGTKVYKNNGNSTFSEVPVETESSITDNNHWGDMNNDGKLELVTADDGGIVIYKYNGTSFVADINLFVRADNFNIGDYNADNKLDIIVNLYPKVYILKNQTTVVNNVPSAPTVMRSTLNSLGYYSVTLSWKEGSDALTPVKGLSYNLRVGTTSGSNNIVSSMTSTTFNSLLQPKMGNVDGNLSWNLVNLKPGKYYWSVQTVDNAFQASAFSAELTFTILPPLSESSFLADGSFTSAGSGADLDGDKDIDLLLTYSTGLIAYEQTAAYTYTQHTLKQKCTIFDIKDINNDNLPDIVAKHNRIVPTELYDSLEIFINKGNFSFQTVKLDSLTFGSVAAADFDNDGDIDIMAYDRGYWLYENKGSLNFTKNKLPFTDNLVSVSLSAIDIDNDNDNDFVVSGRDQANNNVSVTYIYKNKGKKTFEFSQELSEGMGPSRFSPVAAVQITSPGDITWNDFNSDGYPDMNITGMDTYNNNNNIIYLNDGTGNLFRTTYSPRPTNKYNTSWIDFNSDGYIDAIMPKMGFNIDNIIYLNDKNNGFTPLPNTLDSLTTAMYVDAIDVDNDKDKDIVCTYKIPVVPESYTTKTKIYTNNNNYVNNSPSPPTIITSEIDSFTVKLNWNKGYDGLTKSEGMTYNIWVGTANNLPDVISPLSNILTGYRSVESIGNMGSNLSWTIENLPLGTYYWSVQAIDNSLQGSTWTPVKSFKLSALTAIFETDTVCMGFNTNFSDKSVSTNAIESWKWDFGNGNTSTQQNPSFKFAQSGLNAVKLVVKTSTSADSVIKNVYVKPVPDVDFSAPTVCDGQATQFTNSSVLDGLTIDEWHWSFGDGSGSAAPNPGTHGYLVPGSYITRLIAKATNGCSDTIIKTVQVGAIPTAAITSNGNPRFCDGDEIRLSNSYIKSYIYKWQVDGVDITDADSNVYIAKNSGAYTIKVTNTVGTCQTISLPINVTKLNKPAMPVIVADNYEVNKCPGENPVVLRVEQPSNDYTYQWLRNGTPLSAENSSTYSGTNGFVFSGDYTVVAYLSGCLKESKVTTISYDAPPPKPTIYAEGSSVWYLACSNDSAAQYKWYYNGSLISKASGYIYFANHNPGEYYVNIYNTKGCYTSSDVISLPKTVTGIEDIDIFADMIIYPNPSDGAFSIEMNNQLFGKMIIKVINQNGKELVNQNIEKTTAHFIQHIDLSGQPNGTYFISIRLNDKNTNKKIIIK